MTSETECKWPLCECEGVRGEPCPKLPTVLKRGGDQMNAKLANGVLSMLYAEHIDAIRKSVAALEAAASEEDPFVYTEVTKEALLAVMLGLGKVRGAVLSWIEENPKGDGHHHTCSFTLHHCLCPDCDKAAKAMLEHLLDAAKVEPERNDKMRAARRVALGGQA